MHAFAPALGAHLVALPKIREVGGLENSKDPGVDDHNVFESLDR